jgi:hypothetical protein
MVRNTFEYLEFAFTKIFSLYGMRKLWSSFFVGIFFTIFNTLIFGTGIYFLYQAFGSLSIDIRILIIGLVCILFTLVGSMLEYGFYAIIVPERFLRNTERGSDIASDVNLWRERIGDYLWYVMYYSSMTIWLLLMTIGIPVVIGFLFDSFPIAFMVFIFLFWMYIYTCIRFSLAWYHMLFSWDGFIDTFIEWGSLLSSRVWNTLKIVFLYSLIVGSAGSIAGYIVQFFLPDFAWLIGDTYTFIHSEISTIANINDTIFYDMITRITQIFSKYSVEILYSLWIFLILLKISKIIQLAMYHIFYATYRMDILSEKWEK